MLATLPRHVLVPLIVLATSSIAPACRARPTTPEVSADAWATVDGREIRRQEVEKAYRRFVDPAAKPSDAEAMTAKLNVLDELITQELVMAKAKALGVQATAAEVDTAFNERKGNVADDVFQKQLTERGMTAADVREGLNRELTMEKVFEREVTPKITVSEQSVADYYNANRSQFNLSEPAYHVAQIVITPMREDQIANRQNDDATTPAEAERKVKMLFDRLSAGATFGNLAMDYSEDPQTALRGGDLGFLSASELAQAPAPLRDAVLKAQPGTVSQVSAGGAHALVLLVAKQAAGQRDLSSPGVRDNIAAALRDRQEQLLRAAYLAVLRNEAKVVNNLAKQIVAQPAKTPTVAPAAPGGK